MILYIIPPVFMLVAFIFSMLGMGGSQLYIPILFWAGLDFKTEAISLGMLLNVVNSSSSMVVYTIKKMVVWNLALPFAVTMMVFAPLGVWLNVQLPIKPLIIFFALFTLAAGILMLSGWKPKKGKLSKRGKFILGLIAGTILGIITGLIGRGGGSFIVPLLFISGLNPKKAAATSSFIVTVAGISSFISHLYAIASPDWILWGLSSLAVLIGSQLGSRLMVGKLTPKGIKLIFGTVLIVIAIILIIKDVL
jgi:uncharacterized membrane protein YfcA